jgi:alpha-maltose-1-phosphate synthase
MGKPIHAGSHPAGRRSVVASCLSGRLTPHKGVDRLIRALPAGATLTVAGSTGHDPQPPESGYPALLAPLAENRDVQFVGPVLDTELPALYRAAGVFALPSVERPGDVGELHDRLALLFANPTLATEMGRRARELVVQRFTWEQCAERCVSAYRELLEGNLAE